MFLNVIDPLGRLSSLDLGAIESWRLEMRAFASAPAAISEDPPPSKSMLGLALSYIVLGQQASLIIAAFDTETEHEAEQVAAVGLPALTREGNIDRVREAMKVVINAPGQTQASTSALIAQATKLVDLYHDMLTALFGKSALALGSLELPLMGQFEDGKRTYRYALTQHRNQPWLDVTAVADPALGLGAPPGLSGAKPPPVSKGGRAKAAPKSSVALAEPPELNAGSLPAL